jgi:hypothetical protein
MDWIRGEGRLQALAVLMAGTVLAVLIVMFLGDGVNALLHATGADMTLNLAWQSVIVTLVLFGVMIGVACAWSVVAKGHVLAPGKEPGKGIAAGLGLGIGGLALAAGYAAVAGTVSVAKGQFDILLFLLGIPLVLYQCAAEEIYFRGWLQPVVVRAFGPWIGIGVTAVLFAGLHLLAGERAPLSLVNIALAGVLFGLLAWRTGGIAAPVAAHFGWNWAESTLLGLSPNPGTDIYGAVVNLDMTGPALWGGSPEGLNASLAVTFVLLALCVPLAVWRTTPKPALVTS